MRISDLEKRVADLEKRTPIVDECALIIGAMNRTWCDMQGQPHRVHVLDDQLNALAAQASLPDGTSNLILLAWEELHNRAELTQAN